MFTDRKEAGRRLAQRLVKYKGSRKALVIGIPRGGVSVAYEIAKELGLRLAVVVVKKSALLTILSLQSELQAQMNIILMMSS
jgi:putative phosphoribosyl transferase